MKIDKEKHIPNWRVQKGMTAEAVGFSNKYKGIVSKVTKDSLGNLEVNLVCEDGIERTFDLGNIRLIKSTSRQNREENSKKYFIEH